MMFDEYQEAIQLWRQITPTSGWSDPVWTYIQDITGRIEPINPAEQFVQNQANPNIAEVMLSPIDYRTIVRAGDGVMDVDGIQRKIIGHPEIWKWELPHIAARLERVQWTVIS